MERLRMVARAGEEGPGLVAQEAAAALAACAGDPPSLVIACRRLVDHQPTSGPVWWLAARVLAAPDPTAEAWRSAAELEDDPTPAACAYHLAEEALVTVVGWPEQVAAALRRRGDCRVLAVDAPVGGGPAGRRRRAGNDVVVVADSGLGSAAAAADLVLLEARVLGPGGFVATAGSLAAAAVGQASGVPVWVVAGAGRVLPGALWDALVARLAQDPEPWDSGYDVVPLRLADRVVGPAGPGPAEDAPARADCPPVPELTRSWAAPGSRGRGPLADRG
ncbi:MAG TPA: hypothetical protein VG455_03145 [Acidimicrobiales bacterium]|nr:hypothetical protein [Acidimicrobiales bacterium]